MAEGIVDNAFFDAAYQGDLTRMRGSIESGHDVNALPPSWKSVYQPTALAYAVWGNQPEAVRFLLEHGADPNLPDGVSALAPTRHTRAAHRRSQMAKSRRSRTHVAGPKLPPAALGVVQERPRRVRTAARRRGRRP